MESKSERFDRSGIRDKNPCYGCTREWKKPGCHDTCPDRKPWVGELKRVNENRKQYDSKPFVQYNPFDY